MLTGLYYPISFEDHIDLALLPYPAPFLARVLEDCSQTVDELDHELTEAVRELEQM